MTTSFLNIVETVEAAFKLKAEREARYGRAFDVRKDYGVYLVTPHWDWNFAEGYRADAGYAAQGLLVRESDIPRLRGASS